MLKDIATEILTESLHEGEEALAKLLENLVSPDSRLVKERRNIENQEALDSVRDFESDHMQDFDALEEFDYVGTEPDEFEHACDKWVVRNLQFTRDNRGKVARYLATRRTLMLVPAIRHFFSSSLDHQRFVQYGGKVTYPITFDRRHADKNLVPIARIGHSFVDQMEELIRLDDRGIAYAYWKAEPGYEVQLSHADLYFCFDFLIEADTDTALAELKDFPEIAPSGIRRRVEEAFYPVLERVWLDNDLVGVSDPNILRTLNEPYKRASCKNLTADDTWPQVDELGIAAGWYELCEDAKRRAIEEVRGQTNLQERSEQAVQKIRKDFEVAESQLMSRIQSLPDAHSSGDKRSLSLEQHLVKALVSSIEHPVVRIDAVGAVFLSPNSLEDARTAVLEGL